MWLRNLSIGSWDVPEVPLPVGLSGIQPVTKLTLNQPRTAVCPPLAECFDPLGRGIANGLLQPRPVAVDGVNLLFFADAELFGSRFIAAKNDTLYADFEVTKPLMDAIVKGGGDVNINDHRLSEQGEFYTSEILSGAPKELSGVNMLLTSSEPINFGAWLIRVFPKIHHLRKAGALNAGKSICFVDREWQVSLLEWMGIDSASVVRQTLSGHYRVEKLVVPTAPSRNKYLDSGTLEFIAETRARVLSVRQVPRKAIYVSRQAWNKTLDARIASMPNAIRLRPFDQEAEFAARLERLGIEIFSPEEHSFEEALSVFANAKLVVGPQGAGLFNAIFCKPGTPVIEIAHLPYFMQGHANMFLSCGLRYMLIIGDDPDLMKPGAHPVHRPLVIDIDKTVDFIARQLDTCD